MSTRALNRPAFVGRALRVCLAPALLVAGGLVVQQCSGSTATDPSQLQGVASTTQVMDAIVIPNSQAIWDAAVYDNGEIVKQPKTDDEWFALQMNAWAVAEAGNLLKMAPRAKDTGDWMTFSSALTQKSLDVVKAAEAKDVQRLLATGGELYTVCTDCHRIYPPPAQ
jgi:hypothetical protein